MKKDQLNLLLDNSFLFTTPLYKKIAPGFASVKICFPREQLFCF